MSQPTDPSAMPTLEAIRRRRTHRRYTPRPVTREEIETLLDAAVLAPNHKMTEPWRFIVLGPTARGVFAGIRARIKVGPPDGDDEKAAARRAKAISDMLAVPAHIAVLQRLDDDEYRRDEDHAAVWMAVQNMLLAATALGLGTKVGTGRWFGDEELRALLQAREDERVFCLIEVGQPAEDRPVPPRTDVARKTLWLE
jgi:nitroreductase